jgi:hypothetical protein
MNLSDGLERYKGTLFYRGACELERDAQKVTAAVRDAASAPSQSSVAQARDFLIAVERWKAGCLEERTGNAAKNEGSKIWEALVAAVTAESDRDKLCSIMVLRGFGSCTNPETHQRPAKVATSVLRFLFPELWGVVDWRAAATLGVLEKNGWDFDRAMKEAKTNRASDLRECFKNIDEDAAIDYEKRYRAITARQPELPRAADVDMALFGLSLEAWPMG